MSSVGESYASTISCTGPHCGPGHGDLLQELEDAFGSVGFKATLVGFIGTVFHGRVSSLPPVACRSLAFWEDVGCPRVHK